MARAKAKVGKSGGVGISLSLNASIGILLAIIGTFLVFFNGNLSGILSYLIKVTAIFLICVGAVGVVNYFKYKLESAVLVVGLVEIIIGLVLIFAPIEKYLLIIIGAALILYGAVYLFRYHKTAWDFITGLLFIVVGILVLITFWVTHEIFLLIVGIAALIGAAYFLFLA